MAETDSPAIPPEDAPAAPPKLKRRISWRRLRLYFWSILLVLAIDFYATARLIREQPKRMTEMVLARLPYPASIATAKWTGPRTLEITGLQIGGFFYADDIIVTARIYQLMRHHITQVDVYGPQLFTGKLNDALRQGKHGAGGLDWTITKLVVRRGTLMLEDLAPDVPTIPIRLGATQPIILNYLKLNRPDDSPSMSRERIVDIQNVNIVSPFDPLAPVLTLPLTKVRFTYDELWHHHIREVDLTKPTLHLGQDLFYFTDAVKKARKSEPAQGVGAPWQMGRFQVRYGQLAVNAFGQPAVQFPFFFDTTVSDIRLDQLDKISAKSVVAIRRLTQYYPDYKIRVVNLTGKIEFSIPPSDVHANNVVPTVHIDKLAWNGIEATDVASSVTFDPTGIYGKLSGQCEKGTVNGGFAVDYTKNFRWNAKVTAAGVDCLPVSEKLAGKYFSLSGMLDGDVSVTGQATNIQHCEGKLAMRQAGLLEINSMDNLMKKLPGAPGSLEQNAMKIALEAFKEYPYDTGALDLDYTPDGGHASLKLSGPRGKREFTAVLHPYVGTSKVAKDDGSR